jgi:hypothetical protein
VVPAAVSTEEATRRARLVGLQLLAVARSAVGLGSLPHNISVEVEAILLVSAP